MAPKKKENIQTKNASGRDRVGMWLYILYAFILLVSGIIVYKIIYIQYIWNPPQKLVEIFSPRTSPHELEAMRGSILTRDGHVLAVDAPAYQITFDTQARKVEFKDNPEAEKEWLTKARDICELIAELYGNGRRSASDYFREVTDRRAGKNGMNRSMTIAASSTYANMKRLMAHPFAQEGPNRSGIKSRSLGKRKYPYHSVARSLIGNFGAEGSQDTTNIEVRMNHYLSGTAGMEYSRKTDRNASIPDFGTKGTEAVDGMDVRTTLDLGLQLILDDAMHRNIDTVRWIDCGTAILMETRTGAIRAMVNLKRGEDDGMYESLNIAFKQGGEPGSVFKGVASLIAINAGYVTSMFEEMIPTNDGKFGVYGYDKHIRDYQDTTHRREMPMSEGFKVSSNNVFAFINTKYFSTHPQDFYDKLLEWGFGDPVMTDIGPTVKPTVILPQDKGWSPRNLGTVGFGYTVRVTPMHVLNFYNAVANDGRMMRPYFIESIEKDGRIIEKTTPQVLREICTPAQADTLTNSMKLVTGKGGTAAKLGKAPWKVAGKTGTSKIYLDPKERGTRPPGAALQIYETYGNHWKKNQGSFVGFFPADDPQYTIYVTMYSRLNPKSLWGSGYPAQVALDAIRGIYASEPAGEGAVTTGSVPAMATPAVESAEGQIPDVTGMALKDALYTLEKSGYRVNYRGMGHVKRMRPEAGARLAEGKTVELTLE